ncbi:hypothetical protein DPMN_171123 [Dreissena polymorpha]|uniref:Uncharacterized protein n=1 Tax=Dreissena polymorpha TaxID=45954 RepID=A0A9D4E0K4_DREPO|nr:hypothetical protein DPMN_171123 [Dreissena polymorpha]
MIGQTFSDYTFKRSKQAITLAANSSVTVKGATVPIDPQLFFQRLTTVARYGDDYPDLFKYKLSSVPSSLFDIHGLLREPQKSWLADLIWKRGNCSPERNVCESDVVHVIECGSLIQKLP